jgi:hypothetical protein
MNLKFSYAPGIQDDCFGLLNALRDYLILKDAQCELPLIFSEDTIRIVKAIHTDKYGLKHFNFTIGDVRFSAYCMPKEVVLDEKRRVIGTIVKHIKYITFKQI